jgi:predicted signal transduction protein with EAL and GGDEF domain
VTITASIGVAVGQYATPDALLRDADLALYAAKAAGRDRYSLFDASMQDDAQDRRVLEADLGGALQAEQLYILYQPIFDLAAGRVACVEALLRWRHPVRGIVGPDQFIPLAEESGLIVPIGRWVLEEACRQGAAWARSGRDIAVSVNVSASQLGREDFVEDVRRSLQETGLAPSSLLLDITETTVMHDIAAACMDLQQMKQPGVRVALDDFGTGYASLAQLQRVPADILKVDRSFVAALEDGGQSADLLQAIVGVGRSLSMKVLAEGIETAEQLQAVTAMGCELGQGYHLGRPAPVEVIDGLLGLRADPAAVDAPVR